MYRIGLTGGVGSGKSTVSSYMKEFGIPVIDGDCLAMEAVAPGNIAMREIRQVFGNGIFNEDGSLNRLKTAEIIFKDEEKRTQWDYPSLYLAPYAGRSYCRAESWIFCGGT